MYSRGTYFGGNGGSAGYEASAKRPRTLEAASYYGGSPASLQSNVMYGSAYASAYYPQPRTFPVVRLRGLPFHCTEEDVYEFFAGLNIVDVLLLHKNDRFSGEAFCVFGSPMHVEYAIRKDHHNMGRRYIEVFRAKKQEYYQAIASEVRDLRSESGGGFSSSWKGRVPEASKDNTEWTGVLKLRGLPFSATPQDIVDFFREFDISEDDVCIVSNADGRATGEAFVSFRSPEDSKAAMKKDRMTIGSRYVELFPSTIEKMNSAKR
eukprot:TRINITY_DN2969_c0_g1_i1.p1 TRINITY_DN2969_c0_g1~~TRINITY_DN2969_c0_g1_i1.p1  ORF type:complete len:264 (-),score=28.74 TRINITY_DN2969_c0_g1_i1:147-938(-)